MFVGHEHSESRRPGHSVQDAKGVQAKAVSPGEREDSKARGMQTHGIQDVLAKMLRVLRGKLRALEHIKPRMPEACRIEAFRQSGQDAERTG